MLLFFLFSFFKILDFILFLKYLRSPRVENRGYGFVYSTECLISHASQALCFYCVMDIRVKGYDINQQVHFW